MMASHPYLPASLELPNYVPNTMTVMDILGPFFGVVALIMVVCLVLVYKFKLNKADGGLFIWFVCSGLIHLILEGYFGYNNLTLQSDMSFLGQLWKEYSIADSRYVGSDPFVVSMESFTGFVEGPVCLLVAYAIATRASWRFPVQALVSLGQWYGCYLYFAIEYLSKEDHGPYGDPLYYWFYFIFMNGIWMVIPAIAIVQSVRHSSAAHAFMRKNNVKKND